MLEAETVHVQGDSYNVYKNDAPKVGVRLCLCCGGLGVGTYRQRYATEENFRLYGYLPVRVCL